MKETEVLEIIKNIVTIIATAIAAYAALAGLKAWKKQLKGKAEYELARRYLIVVYKFREAFAAVRNPAIFNSEYSSAIKEKENESGFSPEEADRAVYSIRWRKVNEVVSALNVELLEAEALWGAEARSIVKDLLKCETNLYLAVKRHVEKRSDNREKDILYDCADNDPFNTEVNSSIAKIESYLRPHLK